MNTCVLRRAHLRSVPASSVFACVFAMAVAQAAFGSGDLDQDGSAVSYYDLDVALKNGEEFGLARGKEREHGFLAWDRDGNVWTFASCDAETVVPIADESAVLDEDGQLVVKHFEEFFMDAYECDRSLGAVWDVPELSALTSKVLEGIRSDESVEYASLRRKNRNTRPSTPQPGWVYKGETGIIVATGGSESGDGGRKPCTLCQSPYLDEWLLEPMDERLPVSPLIVCPGQYGMSQLGYFGGILSTVAPDGSQSLRMSEPAAFFLDQSDTNLMTGLLPIIESLHPSDDNRTFTVRLRTGLRWSDGEPYTTEDLLFWWNDYVNDPYLGAPVPQWLVQGDEIAEITGIDAITLRISFNNPYPAFDVALDRQRGGTVALPKHYFSRFHPSYAAVESLSSDVTDAGFEDWTDLFQVHHRRFLHGHPDLPSMEPWVTSELSEDVRIRVRNPYYPVVDCAFRQLPYMDEQHTHFIPNAQFREQLVLSGAFTVDEVPWSRYGAFRRAADAGNIQLSSFPYRRGASEQTLSFNWFADDSFKADMFRDKRFRMALNYWVPRDLIRQHELDRWRQYPGLKTVYTEAPWSRMPQVNEERDIDRANELLDEMGLDRRDMQGYRLGPDGEPIVLAITSVSKAAAEGWHVLIDELPKIGFKGRFRSVDSGGHGDVVDGRGWELLGWMRTIGYGARDWTSRHGGSWSTWHPSKSWSLPWYQWIESGGRWGEQPPAWAQRMWDLGQSAKFAETDEELEKTLIELRELHANQLIALDLLHVEPSLRAFGPDVGNIVSWYSQAQIMYYHAAQDKRSVTLNR